MEKDTDTVQARARLLRLVELGILDEAGAARSWLEWLGEKSGRAPGGLRQANGPAGYWEFCRCPLEVGLEPVEPGFGFIISPEGWIFPWLLRQVLTRHGELNHGTGGTAGTGWREFDPEDFGRLLDGAGRTLERLSEPVWFRGEVRCTDAVWGPLGR